MKVIIFSRYEDAGSSSRLRLFQYIPYLESRLIDVKISPLLPNDYVETVNNGKKYSSTKLILRYIMRFWDVVTCSNSDLLIIEKELFPFLPPWTEIIINLFKKPYIVDYDDATFHTYDRHPLKIVRRILRRKISRVMQRATTVIACNEYIKEYALSSGAKNVQLLPTVIDLNKYKIKVRDKKNNGEFIIGWMGSPSTSKYLKLIYEAIEEVNEKISLRLVLIGSGLNESLKIKSDILNWYENTEVEDLQKFDVGIMPLKKGCWEKGKCGYKIIQYMACGLPVIASPVGINSRIIQNGVNGYLAKDKDEWIKYLLLLANDPQKRIELGIVGRKKVESEYCIQVTAKKFINIISEAVNN